MSFGWLIDLIRVHLLRKSLYKQKKYSFESLKTKANSIITFIYKALASKKKKRLQMIQCINTNPTPRNNLLFVARTPQTWTTCILLFNFAWILYTTLHEDTPPHHKTPRFRIFDDIWIVSCHSHSWLVLSSFYIVRKVCKDKKYNLYAQNENDSADISSIFKINKSTNVQDIVCVNHGPGWNSCLYNSMECKV